MAHTTIEKSFSDYKQAVEYVNTELAVSDPISKEQWDDLCTILFKDCSNGIVGYQMKMRAYAVRRYFDFNERFQSTLYIDDLSEDLEVRFGLFLSSEQSVMETQLNEFCSQTELPGEIFLQWLLGDCSEKIAYEYITEARKIRLIPVDFDDRGRSPKSNAEKDDSIQDSDGGFELTLDYFAENELAQDSYDDDESSQEPNIEDEYGLLDENDMTSSEDEPVPAQELFAQLVQQGKNNAVQLALISITTQMAEKAGKSDWRKFDFFIYAGLQMYPHLQNDNIELTPEQFDLCGQLKDFVEDRVAKNHQSRRGFNAAAYIAEQHELAVIRFAERKNKLIAEYPQKPQDFSDDQLDRNRRMVETMTDEWLVPLDNEQLVEICKLSRATANQYLKRYRDKFLDDSYSIIEDNLRRNKKYAHIKLSKRTKDTGTAGE